MESLQEVALPGDVPSWAVPTPHLDPRPWCGILCPYAAHIGQQSSSILALALFRYLALPTGTVVADHSEG
jgi:hypothetical protein